MSLLAKSSLGTKFGRSVYWSNILKKSLTKDITNLLVLRPFLRVLMGMALIKLSIWSRFISIFSRRPVGGSRGRKKIYFPYKTKPKHIPKPLSGQSLFSLIDIFLNFSKKWRNNYKHMHACMFWTTYQRSSHYFYTFRCSLFVLRKPSS